MWMCGNLEKSSRSQAGEGSGCEREPWRCRPQCCSRVALRCGQAATGICCRKSPVMMGVLSTKHGDIQGYYITIISSGWWFGTWMLFSPIVGMMIQSDFHIFQWGWNHQLVIGLCPQWRNYIPNNIGKVDSSGGFGLHRIHILHFGWSGSLSH